MGNLDYLIESRYRCIIPTGFDAAETLGNWAHGYPEMYTVYTTGTISYNNEQALSWFILKWPQ
jgi:basic membrane lipoprotein Med (substrate-binding protein (PBP1-ABC) superfamily)